jgi:biopolymer transport protein ExbB
MSMDFFAQTYAYLQPGGAVMFPLVFSSVWMWVLIIDRLLFYRQLGRNDIPLRQAVGMLSAAPPPAGANGIRAQVVAAFLAERTGDRRIDKKILDRCAMRVRPAIRKALAPIATLLGTVTGMIATFDVIRLFGTGNAKAMAGGISEALITTQSGLTAAIPGLFMSVYLMRRAGRLESRLDETVAALKRQL